MATPSNLRRLVAQRLGTDATGYEFMQVIRLLMRLSPERTAVGGWADPSGEVARFVVPPSLAFPPSEIASITLDDDEQAPARVAVRFFGLTGPQGVLPHPYTEYAMLRSRARDTAFRDFLDLFHHRLLSLFYRAWERNRPVVQSERGEPDLLESHLLDLWGAGTAHTTEQSALPRRTLARYAGLLAMRTRPAVGLAQMVTDYFGVKASVEQFVGEWRTLIGGGQLRLDDDGLDATLGAAVIGDAVYDAQAKVRLTLGPLERAQFDAFLPGGADYDRLRAIARLYADDQVGVDVRLVLRADHIPATCLADEGTPTLGLGTFLRSHPPVRDADAVQFSLA